MGKENITHHRSSEKWYDDASLGNLIWTGANYLSISQSHEQYIL